MGKDTTAFRERFNAYKNGKSVSEIYDAGLPRYAGGKPAYQTFVEEMGPILFQEMVALGVKNPEAAYRNMITLLAYESNYGQSRVARELNNFGGVGWNGKTYTTYKDKADFVRNYVRLMNSRYKNVITADTLYDYAKGLKGLNYYEDSVENYTRNLTGMKSFAKALDAHMANNPDLYVLLLADTKPMSQTTAAELNAISQFQPWLNYHQPDYPLNNPAPSSISSWNNPKSPAYTPAGLQTRRIDFGKMMMDMLEDDWEPPTIQPLKTVNSPDSKIATFTGFKNGKLPRYQTGNTPITTTGGAPVVVPVTTVPDDPGADDVKEVLERVAGFLPYIGTILDWLAVTKGNYNKVPSAIIGTVADAFLPGLKSAYKAYKSYNILSKTAPKIVDKIVYGKKAAKAGQKLSANGAYQAVGTYQDVLDDQGYMSKHKNGKLPLFEDGTSGVLMVLHPISSIRKRLYDHVFPYGYNNAVERAFSALAKNKPHISENYGKWSYRGNEQRLDDLWGTYLQIPDSQRHYPRVLTKSKYSPTISKDDNDVYYSVPLSNEEKHHIVNHALWYGNDKDAPKLLNPDFGNFTVGRGRDSNGDYASWYDTWDLNPARGISNIGGNIAKKLGLDKIEDLSFGVGKPFSLYDRIYLDDYYGVKGNNRGGIYLPEITVRGRNKKIELEEEESQSSGEYNNGELPEYKNGKSSIHINPANRGKFNATKKRTGKTTEELAHSKNPLTRKRAIFALNARKWKH